MSSPARLPAIEQYLDRLRAGLRGLPAPEVEDILLELRGHIAERSESGEGLEAVLRSLGDPMELARQYRIENVTARAECTRSPIVVLHSLLLLRHASTLGWMVLALATLGYAWAIALGAAAIEKIFSPRDVGLWHRTGSLWPPILTVEGPGPQGTHELLGWWFIPFGLVGCVVLLLVTRWFALWWIRRSASNRYAPE